MAERTLRTLAILLSLVVAAGFVLFALEDIDRASKSSRDRIVGESVAVDPTPRGERERERRNSAVREAIDEANDVLLKPFAAVAENHGSRWVRRGVPALLGLLAYGVLLAFLARYANGRGSRAWRRRALVAATTSGRRRRASRS